MRENIIAKLTIRHLMLNKGRTFMTLFGIMLSVAMVCCIAGFTLSIRQLGIDEIKSSKGDYHTVFVDVTKETADLIAAEELFSTSYTKDGDTEGFLNIYLRLGQPGGNIIEVCQAIADKYGVMNWGLNTELLTLEGVFGHDTIMAAFAGIATVAVIIVVAGSVLVIANAFYISASERIKQFGLLKSIGATKSQLRGSILFEAFLLAVIAMPLGVLLGFGIQSVVLWLTNSLLGELFALNETTVSFQVIFDPLIIYLSVGVSLLTVLISAWLPARQAARVNAIEAIRQTNEIKIRGRKIKTSPLTRKLFGFEGLLAAKSLKRSRGKYRATVVSLTVSIVLFISIASLVATLNKGADMQYGGYDFDLIVFVNGSKEVSDDVENIVYNTPNDGVLTAKRTTLTMTVPEGFTTADSPEGMIDGGQFGMLVYPMPDSEYLKFAPDYSGGMSGILVNTATVTRDSQVREFVPYSAKAGTELMITAHRQEELSTKSILIDDVVEAVPDTIPPVLFTANSVNVLMPESAYEAFLAADPEVLTYNTDILHCVTAKDPDAFQNAVVPVFEERGYEERIGIDINVLEVTNLSQITRLYNNITLIVELFGYGFIAMLSLIAVTSVIATISTGMALRRSEFATLFSVGMTSSGMNKMLNLESLMYGTKALIIGLPIGLAFSFLIHSIMGNLASFAYEPPWGAVIISIAAVMLLTFGTMRYGKRKLAGISIVEAIRSETT